MKISRTVLTLAAAALILIALILVFQRGPVDDPAARTSPSREAPQGTPGSDRPTRSPPREADRLLQAEGARTDVTLSQFPIKEYQHLRAPGGKPAGATVGEAYIHVPSAGRRVAMEPNQLGEFPTVGTLLSDTVGVRLSLDVKPGTPVRVVLLDGGSFPASTGVSQVLKATAWRGVAFEFTTSANIGAHRVLVCRCDQFVS